jgi:DNA-binding transcriptional ArsR family regulator
MTSYDEIPGPDPSSERDDIETINELILTTAGLAHIPPPAPLIDGLLYRDSLAMLYGPSGVGKTFVALTLALCVAADRGFWLGHEVTPGKVLYIAAEGVSGVSARVEAWHQYRKLEPGGDEMMWFPQALNLSEPRWVDALAEFVAKERPTLIVFDTLARCTVGAEENSAKDMGNVIENLETIRRASGACVLVVHHTGKDASAKARGSSALRGAMTTEIELTGSSSAMLLKIAKQKDAAEASPHWLRLQMCYGSMVVVKSTSQDVRATDSTASAILEALKSLDLGNGITMTDLTKETGIARTTIQRHLKMLIEADLVVREVVGKSSRFWVATT